MNNRSPYPSLVLGTAGHIDHGKSSLIQALTGTNPDRLLEEKRRGITIELGFAQLILPDNTTLGVVDVPGHERFIRQMIAGATGIDLALLCIAADDGVMPQTTEHLAVLELLGIPTCVVALTKCDLVDDEWIELLTEEVHTFLQGTPFEGSPIVPVSSRENKGLDTLKEALMTCTKNTPVHKHSHQARLPIDRVFSIKGAGTVITGTLWSGTVSPGDELELLPQRETARVRTVEVHGKNVDCAFAGMRVAVNLNACSTSEVQPGNFAVTPHTLDTTDRFDAWFNRVDVDSLSKPLKSGTRLRVAHGAREVSGRILFMNDQESLTLREGVYAQLRLDETLPVSWGDRFVARSYSPPRVVGGGTILCAHPRRRTRLTSAEQTLLEALKTGDELAICDTALTLETHPTTAGALAARSGLKVEVVERYFADLVSHKSLEVVAASNPICYATRSVLARDLAAIENTLLRYHSENPLSLGITKAELAQRCWKNIDPVAVDALIKHVHDTGRVVYADGLISHPQAGGGAKRAEEQAAHTLLELLRQANDAPPTTAELIAATKLEASLAHRALGALEKQGLVVRVSKEFSFEYQALEALKQATIAHFKTHQQATASDLKGAMNTSRKYAMPLLEYFDARGITQREGDLRRLR